MLVKTGTTLVSKVGGASGPLYGSAFRAIGKALRRVRRSTPPRSAPRCAAGLAAIQKLGAAVPGDKTIVDALGPAVEAFEQAAPEGLAAAAAAAASAAEAGREGDDRAAGAQGPGLLPRPAQRRPPGPGGDEHRADLPRPRLGPGRLETSVY